MHVIHLFVFDDFAFLEFFYGHDLVSGFISGEFDGTKGALSYSTGHHVIVNVYFFGLLKLH
jgi:hypothetical protein